MIKLCLITLISLITLTFSTSHISHTYADTKEADAIYKLTKGNFPFVEEAPEQNVLQKIASFLTSILEGRILFKEPQDKDGMYARAVQDATAYFPKEIQHPEEGEKKFTGSLGKNTGVWGAEFPLEVTDSDQISRYECTYEKANFPPGVHPIAPGQGACQE
jgi:hypothetical protein